LALVSHSLTSKDVNQDKNLVDLDRQTLPLLEHGKVLGKVAGEKHTYSM
jgi:hypothetical protein